MCESLSSSLRIAFRLEEGLGSPSDSTKLSLGQASKELLDRYAVDGGIRERALQSWKAHPSLMPGDCSRLNDPQESSNALLSKPYSLSVCPEVVW